MSKSKLALAAVMVSGLVWALPSQAADLTPARAHGRWPRRVWSLWLPTGSL